MLIVIVPPVELKEPTVPAGPATAIKVPRFKNTQLAVVVAVAAVGLAELTVDPVGPPPATVLPDLHTRFDTDAVDGVSAT